MDAEMKAKPDAKKLTTLLVLLAILALVMAAFRFTWLAGRKSLVNDLGMDGYRVTVDAVLERGEGRCGVQVWRDGGWMEVER